MSDKANSDWIDALAKSTGADESSIRALRDNIRLAKFHREEALNYDSAAEVIIMVLRSKSQTDKAMRLQGEMLDAMLNARANGETHCGSCQSPQSVLDRTKPCR